MHDPMQLARLAALEGALAAMLHAACDGSPDDPDTVTAEFGADGLSVEFWRGGVPVGGLAS